MAPTQWPPLRRKQARFPLLIQRFLSRETGRPPHRAPRLPSTLSIRDGTRFGVRGFWNAIPRVARASQPWAMG